MGASITKSNKKKSDLKAVRSLSNPFKIEQLDLEEEEAVQAPHVVPIEERYHYHKMNQSRVYRSDDIIERHQQSQEVVCGSARSILKQRSSRYIDSEGKSQKSVSFSPVKHTRYITHRQTMNLKKKKKYNLDLVFQDA